MEPCTHFSNRAEDVALSLSPTGVRPSAEEAMIKEDERITGRLEELEALIPNGDDAAALRQVGSAWASGNADDAEVLQAMLAPSRAPLLTIAAGSRPANGGGYRVLPAPSRLAQIRGGAKAALIAAAEKPSWSTEKLVATCRKGVVAWFDGVAEDATRVLADLPEYARAHVAAGKDVRGVGKLIDSLATPVAEVEALRAAVGPWSVIKNAQLRQVYATMATGQVFVARDRFGVPDIDADAVEAATQDIDAMEVPDGVFWTADADVLAAGISLDVAVLGGLAKLAPLADPLGRDAEELAERRALYGRFTSFVMEHGQESEIRMYTALSPLGAREMVAKVRKRRGWSPERALAEFRGR